MIILTRKVFCFVNQETNQSREAANKYVTKGAMTMEEAPDWIKNDPLFQWAQADGDIIIAESSSAKAEAAAVSAAISAIEAGIPPIAGVAAVTGLAAAVGPEPLAAVPAKAGGKGKK